MGQICCRRGLYGGARLEYKRFCLMAVNIRGGRYRRIFDKETLLMLTRKRKCRYLIKRWLLIRRHLMSYAGSGSMESLHRMRVEIKKLKAYLKFAVWQGGMKKHAAQPVIIKWIFRRAGVIREAGVNLQLLQQFKVPHAGFRAGESRKMEMQFAEFRSDASLFDNDLGRAFKKLLGALRPAKERTVRHWLARQLKGIAKNIASPGTEQLHLARKKIKSLIYFIGLIPGRLARKSKINTAYLDQLQDAIGKWHDLDITVSLLAFRKIGNDKVISRIKKARDQAAVAVQDLGAGFGEKVFAEPVAAHTESR